MMACTCLRLTAHLTYNPHFDPLVVPPHTFDSLGTPPHTQVLAPLVTALSRQEVLSLMPKLLVMPGTNLRELYKKLATTQSLKDNAGNEMQGVGGSGGDYCIPFHPEGV